MRTNEGERDATKVTGHAQTGDGPRSASLPLSHTDTYKRHDLTQGENTNFSVHTETALYMQSVVILTIT